MAATSKFETDHEREAYELGVEHAKNAASWIVDGNTKREFIPAVLEMIENGDPAAEDYLPREPNLSGEYADDPTPTSLARDIVDPTADDDELGSTVIEEIADAYEAGVADTFLLECERILRAALDES